MGRKKQKPERKDWSAEQYCAVILDVWDKVEAEYLTIVKQMGDRDGEQQDLLHEIELGQLTTKQKTKVFNQLRDCRQERRRLKDEFERLEFLYNVLQKSKSYKQMLQSAQSSIAKKIRTQNSRNYNPRVRDDLTIAGGSGNGNGFKNGEGVS